MKVSAVFRFYEELNDFLPPERRKRDFVEVLEENASIKEATDRMGVPFDEIDLILVNGKPADPGHILGDGDRVSLYPTFELLDIGDITRVRAQGLRRPRFILPREMRRLAEHMQARGFDVLFDPSLGYGRIREVSEKEKRIILAPNRPIPALEGSSRIVRLEHNTAEEQARKIIETLDLTEPHDQP